MRRNGEEVLGYRSYEEVKNTAPRSGRAVSPGVKDVVDLKKCLSIRTEGSKVSSGVGVVIASRYDGGHRDTKVVVDEVVGGIRYL